jgi:nucleoid-associated protein YgaU
VIRWVSAVSVLLAGYEAGKSGLEAPQLSRPSALPDWWRWKGPLVASFALARLALLAVGFCWIAILSAVMAGWAWRSAARGRPTGGRPAGVRHKAGPRVGKAMVPTRVLRLALGTTAAGTVLAACDGAGTALPPPRAHPAPVIAGLGPALGHPSPLDRGPSPAPVHQALAPPVKAPASRLAPRAPRAPKATKKPHAPHARPVPAATWTVRPGDDLWSIAEATLANRSGRAPTEREVAAYWMATIRANRSRLPDPADPSLLYPGDTVILPAAG